MIIASPSDTIVISTDADYLDSLAFKYYGDPTLWWIIALANNIGKGRLAVPSGIQLRIPTNTSELLVQFHNLNK
jgi:nucleoid-associated protein YgaU